MNNAHTKTCQIYLFSLQSCPAKLFLVFFILSLSIFQGQAIYENPPPYFNSFYCNLGTKTIAQSGTYSCTSPRVIEKADKFALSLVEFNKEPSVAIWFQAQVTSTPGDNLTSVEIRLLFKTTYTTRYGYMVVVIGYQPENDWLDVINLKLPSDPNNIPVSLPNTSGSRKYFDWVIGFPSSQTFLLTYTHRIIFATSFGIETANSNQHAQIDLSPLTGPTSLTIRIWAYSNNIIRTIFMGVLVFNQHATPSNTVYKLSSQYDTAGIGTLVNDFHVDDFKQYGSSFNTKCLIGYRYVYLNFYILNDRAITLLNSTNNNYFRTQTSSAGSIRIRVFFSFLCFADIANHVPGDFEFFDPLTGKIYADETQCPLQPTTSTPNQCQKCSQLQCLNCKPSNGTKCQYCDTIPQTQLSDTSQKCICVPWSSSQNSPQFCQPCSFTIPDCLSCTYDGVKSKVQCTLCSDKFNVDQKFRCEQCKEGIYSSRDCYYLPGCSSIQLKNNSLYCLSCSLPNFQYDQKAEKCVCQQGFNYNTVNETCNAKCGDGFKVFLQACDDGNLIIGDGCNAQCQKQESFVCSEDNSSKTKCIFSDNITVNLILMMKVQNQNKVQIHFNITPAPSTLYLVDWYQTMRLEFSFNETIGKPIVSFSYNQGILVLTLEYFNNIEGTSCVSVVKFNSSIVQSAYSLLQFELKGQNAQLIYQNQIFLTNQKIIDVASYALGIIALVCFMVSSFYHEMIGLQTLQFIQLIYFVRITFTGDTESTVMAFNSLKHSNGFSEISLLKPDQLYSLHLSPPMFQKMRMSFYYLENCNLMIVPIFISFMMFVVFKIRCQKAKSNYLQTKNLLQKDKFINLDRKARSIRDHFIFTYSMALLYLTIFQMLIYVLSDLSGQRNVESLYMVISLTVNLAVVFLIMFVFCSLTLQGFTNYVFGLNNKKNHFNLEKSLKDTYHKDYHPLYSTVYLLYQFCLIILITFTLTSFQYLTELMIGFVLLYTVAVWFWKPYTLPIHNFTNTFNQVVVLLFLILQILGEHNLLNDELKITSLYATIIFIVVALVLQVIRVYVYKKSFKREFKVQKAEIKKTPKQMMYMRMQNSFLVQNQIAKQIHDKGFDIIFDRSQKMNHQKLNSKLREISQFEQQIQRKKFKPNQDYQEEDQETLKRIKQRIKRGPRHFQS